jgi:ribosomal 50S subunit-associated protein YjgA (DUF615 family)
MFKNAITKATITNKVAKIALIAANNVARFRSIERWRKREMSALRCALVVSLSAIAFNICDLSTTRFIRKINTEMNAARAPSRNAGAIAYVISCDSWLTDGGIGNH